MKKITSAIAAGLALFAAAHAAPITFYTTNDGHDADGVGSKYGDSQTYEKHGLSMTVSAEIFKDDGSVDNSYEVEPDVGKYGTYIKNGRNDSSDQVDGYGLNERLVLDFSMPVKILSVTFSYVGSDDGFDFFFDVDKDNVLDWVFQGEDIPGGGWYGTFDFTTLTDMYVGDVFGLGASEADCIKYKKRKCKEWSIDDWMLKAVTVDKHIPEVPVPAALPLFLAGLGALGWAKKRRTKKAAA